MRPYVMYSNICVRLELSIGFLHTFLKVPRFSQSSQSGWSNSPPSTVIWLRWRTPIAGEGLSSCRVLAGVASRYVSRDCGGRRVVFWDRDKGAERRSHRRGADLSRGRALFISCLAPRHDRHSLMCVTARERDVWV